MNMKKSLHIAIPFFLLVVVYGLIIHGFFDITKVTYIKYILIQCFVILAPGMVCVKYLFGNKEKSVVHWISLAYALGYSLNILEYMLIWGFRLQQFSTAIIIIVTVAVVVLWFYKPIDVEFDEIKQHDYIIFFIFMIYMLINIVAYSGNNISPFVGAGGSSISRDIQFWCDNAVSLKKSFLPQSAYFSGTSFFYHYFSSIHIAFISQVSGISVFDLAFTLFSFGKCVLLIGALDYLIDRYYFGNIKYLFYVCILFSTGWERKSIVTFGLHLNYNPFGYDIGFAFGLYLVALVLDLLEKPMFDICQFSAIMLIWTTLSGAKGPVAVLLILVPGFACFLWLFQKKYKMAFGYGITFLGIFGVINIFCVGIIRILNHTAEAITSDMGRFRNIHDVISKTPYEVRYRNIGPAMIWYAYNTHPVLFLISLINTGLLIWLLASKKMRVSECSKIVILVITIVIGFIVGRFYIAGGSSEMYFTMAMYIPCLAYNLEVFSEVLHRGMRDIKWLDTSYKAIFISISMIGIYCWALTDYMGGIVGPLTTGHNIIAGSWEPYLSGDTFTRREANACVWIRDNTLQDAIVQSNRFVAYPTRSYYVGIFSERIQYLEATELIYYCDLGIEEPHIESTETARRSEIISSAFDGNKEAIKQLKDEGVNYLMQDNLLYENKLIDADLSEVYNQNDIVIYEIN